VALLGLDEELWASMAEACDLAEISKLGSAFGVAGSTCGAFDAAIELECDHGTSSRRGLANQRRAPSSRTDPNPCRAISSQVSSDFCRSTNTLDIVSLCDQYANHYQVAGSHTTQTIGKACEAVTGSTGLHNLGSILHNLCGGYDAFTSQIGNCNCPSIPDGAVRDNTTCKLKSCPKGSCIVNSGYECRTC